MSRRGSWLMTQSLWLQVLLGTNLFSPCTTLHIAIACTEDMYAHAQGNPVYVLCVYVLVVIAVSVLYIFLGFLISVVYINTRCYCNTVTVISNSHSGMAKTYTGA